MGLIRDKGSEKDTASSIGERGEKAAKVFYEKHGYAILDTNYWKPYGEIDIIAKKRGVLTFIEVKSVSCRTFANVSHGTYDPAENLHTKKRERLKRVIQAYLASHRYEGEWRCDLALVFVNTVARRSRVELFEDVIL